MVTRGPSGKDLGGYRKRGWWALAPRLWHSLSPLSVCKKSPNVLAALLPPLHLSLKQCWRWMWPCAGKGGFPVEIRPEKECIKSCETCFANTLNLNDKGPGMKWVCFPKVLWPFSHLTLTLNKSSELFECYLLFDHYCLTKTDGLNLRMWVFGATGCLLIIIMLCIITNYNTLMHLQIIFPGLCERPASSKLCGIYSSPN